MFLVGLTGGIASGKSTVSAYLQQLGIHVIDADELSRIVEPGKSAYHRIVQLFGSEVVQPDGQLDRKKLGSIVFGDDLKRKQLNSIVHPEIRKLMIWRVLTAFLQGRQFVVLDVPLLFESQLNRFCHKTVVVYCTKDQQLQRLITRDSCSEADATARIAAQLDIEVKRNLADLVIDNRADPEWTRSQADEIFHSIAKSHWHLVPRTFFTVTLTLLAIAIYHRRFCR